MSMIEKLNSQYIRLLKGIDALQICNERIAMEIRTTNADAVKIENAIKHLHEAMKMANYSEYSHMLDTVAVGEKYVACIQSLLAYKSSLLQYDIFGKNKVMDAKEQVILTQEKYESACETYGNKYNYKIVSEANLLQVISLCVGNTLSSIQKKVEEIKKEAAEEINKNVTVELKRGEVSIQNDTLPDGILIARRHMGRMQVQLLNDIGIHNSYQDITSKLRNQGNVLIESEFSQMDEEGLDNFILSYIFRFIESFPMGAVNVHLFDQNTSYLYKRLCNSFQIENAAEGTKHSVQIHSDMAGLTTFRDVICEDIFKKTSSGNKPDLYAVYEDDTTEPFNLIVLRDGLVDGNGYASGDVLDTISALTKPKNIGHTCGLRFLVIDNSASYEKNLTPNAKYKIEQIRQNCEMILSYNGGEFTIAGEKVEALHISGDFDLYVQEKSREVAESLNNREKNHISLDDISHIEQSEKMHSIMYIPVGKSGSNVVELPLSCNDDGKNGAAGQCIGYMAIGQSGSGKSSFFHSLVINGCKKYSPKELQFWLLDFKSGGASSKYINSGLPHIRIIAENNKIDDAFCLFKMILEEMERRYELFNKNFVNDVVSYNKLAEENGLEYFPRIIIAIDEVQEIFREDNASALQKDIAKISSRMRAAGMHFVMVAQNLSEGKSYMLKDSFLPSATGRICFRVAVDIPRDSGFEEEFVQRRQEITELKTGEAYVSYGKDTIKKVKMAYISPEEMSGKYFDEICRSYPEYESMKPLIIGSKQRLSIVSRLQGKKEIYHDVVRGITKHNQVYEALLGEDVYRMSPLKIRFSQYENSSVLLLGSDKQIASSLCATIVASLLKSGVTMHMFNGDRSKVQGEYETVPHAFMYMCQNAGSYFKNVQNHRMAELKDTLKEMYSEYLQRQALVQQADDEDPEFTPLFLVINDLFAFDSFMNNEMIQNDVVENKDSSVSGGLGFDFNIFEGTSSSATAISGQFRDNVQNIVSTLVKMGWRYNIHVILAIKGDPSVWRSSRIVSEISNVVLFNSTEYAEQFDNSYYLKEMLKNIANNPEEETLAVWVNRKSFSKIRPVIYNMSDTQERLAVEMMTRGE